MSELDKLIEAVEAGECPDFCPLWHGVGLCTEAEGAFCGSLDAAKRLHEALLPGWHLTDMWINGDGLMGGAGVWRDGVAENEAFHAHASSAARAWLLAILKALRATEAGE